MRRDAPSKLLEFTRRFIRDIINKIILSYQRERLLLTVCISPNILYLISDVNY